jgi:hypothetical protein
MLFRSLIKCRSRIRTLLPPSRKPPENSQKSTFMLILHCLRKTIATGGSHFPIFVGFSTAGEFADVAEAPAFTKHTTHSDICTNILTPPVKDWQRPLSDPRISQIASVYSQPGELMPNPVLLCENTTLGHRLIVTRQQTNSGVPTEVWEVEIDAPAGIPGRPLWILDGQHRIRGLAASAQSASPLPVVLLLNQGQTSYSGPALAKIFAQVTTEATPLTDLHQEWLTFAFKLKAYDTLSPSSAPTRSAMEAVAELCRKPTVGSAGAANPFHNAVRFNDHDTAIPRPHPGGFGYSCIELKDLFLRHYYNASPTVGHHLTPIDLVTEFVVAFQALVASVTAPQQESVFFGSTAKNEQKIMQDAFIAGVLSAILERGAGQDWIALLRDLQFPTTNWNFSTWTVTLNGVAQTQSKSLAIQVFSTAFRTKNLPTSPGNLADYLQGNGAWVEFAFSRLTPRNRATSAGRSTLRVVGGNTLSQQISPARHVKVSGRSGNIAKLDLIDGNSPVTRLEYFRQNGFVLDAGSHANPVKLHVRMHHYGGTSKEATLTIGW